MLVVVYGTLRRGQRLHDVLRDHPCAGLGVVRGGYVMVETPAGFPAVMEPGAMYYDYLCNIDTREMFEDIDDDAGLAQGNGLRAPVIEIYSVPDRITMDRMDIIEGVGRLYRRVGWSAYATYNEGRYICEDRVDRQEGIQEWRRLHPTQRTFELEESNLYVEGYALMPSDEWIQGSRIIWNGDFLNPQTHPDLVWEYSDFAAQSRMKQAEMVRARKRWATPAVELDLDEV